MTRLHLPQPLAVGAELVVPAESAHHICKVLRLGVGDALHVFNADDGEFAATLTAAEGKTATVHCDAELERIAEPPVHITLMQALATGDRVDTAIQKATELGVAAIVLFRAERSQGKLSGNRQASKLAHWQRVATAAAEQCGRCSVPAVTLASAGLPAANDDLAILLHPEAEHGLPELPQSNRMSLAIGPEGGFSDAEIAQAQSSGWRTVRCGPRVLRTETAGPAVLAALQALYGDWR